VVAKRDAAPRTAYVVMERVNMIIPDWRAVAVFDEEVPALRVSTRKFGRIVVPMTLNADPDAEPEPAPEPEPDTEPSRL